mmetsp:Transcript_6544/g.26655  ORF Transcript_6544/g.26655 Transcript_6544/m.26655 type:complete len:403 (-) Transcript_6544:234-1442(-)
MCAGLPAATPGALSRSAAAVAAALIARASAEATEAAHRGHSVVSDATSEAICTPCVEGPRSASPRAGMSALTCFHSGAGKSNLGGPRGARWPCSHNSPSQGASAPSAFPPPTCRTHALAQRLVTKNPWVTSAGPPSVRSTTADSAAPAFAGTASGIPELFSSLSTCAAAVAASEPRARSARAALDAAAMHSVHRSSRHSSGPPPCARCSVRHASTVMRRMRGTALGGTLPCLHRRPALSIAPGASTPSAHLRSHSVATQRKGASGAASSGSLAAASTRRTSSRRASTAARSSATLLAWAERSASITRASACTSDATLAGGCGSGPSLAPRRTYMSMYACDDDTRAPLPPPAPAGGGAFAALLPLPLGAAHTSAVVRCDPRRLTPSSSNCHQSPLFAWRTCAT